MCHQTPRHHLLQGKSDHSILLDIAGSERTTLADAGKGSQTYIFRLIPEYDMQMPAAFILPLVILHAAELT